MHKKGCTNDRCPGCSFIIAFAEVLEGLGCTGHRAHFDFKVGLPQRKGGNMLNITITDEQKVQVTLKPVTPGGKPVSLDGAPTWEVSSGDATLDVAADGMSATLISGTNLGDSTITVSADADLGAGVVEVADAIVLTVEGAQASSLGLVAGTPVLK